MKNVESKKLGLFDITNNINMKTGELTFDEIRQSYTPFIINKAFSQTKDTIFYANEMNCNSTLPVDMQYDFYYHLIPKKKRYGKWNKKDTATEEFINIIQEVYDYSYTKAQEVLPILKPYEAELRKCLDKGGIQKTKGNDIMARSHVNTDELVDSFFEIDELDNDQFLRVKETLTRVGLVVRNDSDALPVLNQTCHILHKQCRYYIVHFKQMFLLDDKGYRTFYSDADKLRTQKVVSLLQRWGLIDILSTPEAIEDDYKIGVTVIPFKDKSKWELKSKYNIGEKHYDQSN